MLMCVEAANDIAEFLTSRRARVTPQHVGLPTWWAAHNVRYHRTGTRRLRHPVVGELELAYEMMDISADDGLTVSIHSAEPGSRSQEARDLLASWTATPQEDTATADH
jgi:hypothetical protein